MARQPWPSAGWNAERRYAQQDACRRLVGRCWPAERDRLRRAPAPAKRLRDAERDLLALDLDACALLLRGGQSARASAIAGAYVPQEAAEGVEEGREMTHRVWT